jgi:hypothetical protein
MSQTARIQINVENFREKWTKWVLFAWSCKTN